ncbi:uncharacterized protein LOC132062005 [Lycium ferocissimum]|uniref:uncharacterized protein LOC132062005 n=1 Tax=Lycium ferocissimum TaxID=112874 RepID=UPI002815C286|nr:uncharacterized protein LOC132062005 [Lycium ferocissimum]
MDTPVTTRIQIGSHIQHILYEGEGFLCTTCGRLGHSTIKCQFYPYGKPKPKDTNTDSAAKNQKTDPSRVDNGTEEWKTVPFPWRKRSPKKNHADEQSPRRDPHQNTSGVNVKIFEAGSGKYLSTQKLAFRSKGSDLSNIKTTEVLTTEVLTTQPVPFKFSSGSVTSSTRGFDQPLHSQTVPLYNSPLNVWGKNKQFINNKRPFIKTSSSPYSVYCENSFNILPSTEKVLDETTMSDNPNTNTSQKRTPSTTTPSTATTLHPNEQPAPFSTTVCATPSGVFDTTFGPNAPTTIVDRTGSSGTGSALHYERQRSGQCNYNTESELSSSNHIRRDEVCDGQLLESCMVTQCLEPNGTSSSSDDFSPNARVVEPTTTLQPYTRGESFPTTTILHSTPLNQCESAILPMDNVCPVQTGGDKRKKANNSA